MCVVCANVCDGGFMTESNGEESDGRMQRERDADTKEILNYSDATQKQRK